MIPSIKGIPVLGFGTYPLLGSEAEAAVTMALEAGYRHIDTAQMYGNEASVGTALKLSGVPRRDLYVVTKVDPSNIAKEKFMASVNRSVEALNDAVDLLLLHWPPAHDQIYSALDELMNAKAKGFTRDIGISNFSVSLMEMAQQHTGGQIVCNQVEFHPLLDQTQLLAAAHRLGIALAAYCPLARGAALKHRTIAEIAAQRNVTASEIVLRWITQQNVVAIPMTTKQKNAESNLSALKFSLDKLEMAAISSMGTMDGRIVAPEWMQGRW